MQLREAAAGLDRQYQDNLRLSHLEYEQRHVYLYSRPRCLGIVLANACNIDCIHCYQSKNGNNLLRPTEIAASLRRELVGFYPYLTTLRIHGGEVFAIPGFRELVEDVARHVDRAIVSISTNGTMIDEEWAERIVRTPFSNVTVSIDGGTRATYNRLRKGADLDVVLSNVARLQKWKARLGSALPHLDSFFVIMRSNFREIPAYLAMMRDAGMMDVSLQILELSKANTARIPTLEADESITSPGEIAELHAILREEVPRFRQVFRLVRLSGLQTLFESQGLGCDFLEEGEKSLYPDSDGLSDGPFELCPNPWTSLYLVENGDAHLCFLSEAIGNLYSDAVANLWNSPRAMAKRADMIAGRYVASGCSRQHCSWREGHPSPGRAVAEEERSELVQLQIARPADETVEDAGALALVRRLFAEERRRRSEIEVYKRQLETQIDIGQKHIDQLEADSVTAHQKAQAHIDHLEEKVTQMQELLAEGQRQLEQLESQTRKAIADFQAVELESRSLRSSKLVRVASRISALVGQ